jgi:hypothetical protein
MQLMLPLLQALPIAARAAHAKVNPAAIRRAAVALGVVPETAARPITQAWQSGLGNLVNFTDVNVRLSGRVQFFDVRLGRDSAARAEFSLPQRTPFSGRQGLAYGVRVVRAQAGVHTHEHSSLVGLNALLSKNVGVQAAIFVSGHQDQVPSALHFKVHFLRESHLRSAVKKIRGDNDRSSVQYILAKTAVMLVAAK